MQSWPPGHLHHTACTEPPKQLPLIVSIGVHDPDFYIAPTSIGVEDDPAAVRRPCRIVAADGSGLIRQLLWVRTIGVHNPDLAVSCLVACPKHDVLADRRPIGCIRVGTVFRYTVGQLPLARTIAVHYPDLRTATLG